MTKGGVVTEFVFQAVPGRSTGTRWRGLLAATSILAPIGLMALLGESHHYADALLRPGFDGTPGTPTLLSTIKLRQAGFGACCDSEETLRYWAQELAARGLTPPRRP